MTTAGVGEESVMENKLNLWEDRSILKPVGLKSERRSLRNGKIHEADEGCFVCEGSASSVSGPTKDRVRLIVLVAVDL